MKPAPKPEEAEDQELGELDYLLDWYDRLRRRTHAAWSVNPVLFESIEAFFRLYQLEWDDLDIDTLEKLDAVWLNCQEKTPRPKTKG